MLRLGRNLFHISAANILDAEGKEDSQFAEIITACHRYREYWLSAAFAIRYRYTGNTLGGAVGSGASCTGVLNIFRCPMLKLQLRWLQLFQLRKPQQVSCISAVSAQKTSIIC